jgi:hypothetical protein
VYIEQDDNTKHPRTIATTAFFIFRNNSAQK